MSLEAVFSAYAAFGAGAGKGGAASLESAKFAKVIEHRRVDVKLLTSNLQLLSRGPALSQLCRESGVIAGKLTPASVDMAFTKSKGVGGRQEYAPRCPYR